MYSSFVDLKDGDRVIIDGYHEEAFFWWGSIPIQNKGIVETRKNVTLKVKDNEEPIVFKEAKGINVDNVWIPCMYIFSLRKVI